MKLRFTIAALLVCSIGALAQSVRRDGLWEVKSELSMPGMQMPATTTKQCITREDADDPQKAMMPSGRGNAASDCKVSDYKMVGNKASFNVTCPSQGVKMATELTYATDSYTGTSTMEMGRGGQTMTMTTKYTAKRLGDCTATTKTDGGR